MKKIFRFVFASQLPMEEIKESLLLAILAAESLHGESRVRLETGHYFDADGRTCVIDATTDVGRDVNQLFVGFLRREFGDDSFQVEPVESILPAAEAVARGTVANCP